MKKIYKPKQFIYICFSSTAARAAYHCQKNAEAFFNQTHLAHWHRARPDYDRLADLPLLT
jgi:hypothetical protein